jgi:hypothetical protein
MRWSLEANGHRAIGGKCERNGRYKNEQVKAAQFKACCEE